MGVESKLYDDVAHHPNGSTATPAAWSKESGMRPRIELAALLDDDGEIITVVEPWRLRSAPLHR